MLLARSAIIGALALVAAPAVASTLAPTAVFNSTGTLSISSSGFTATGDIDAQYRQPPSGPRGYVFSSALSFGQLTVSPTITVSTPQIGTGNFGIPSQTFQVTPSIPIASFGTVFEGSFQSPDIDAGEIFAFDFGSALLGTPLSFGELVQNQFETGNTTVSVAGVAGPFGGTFDYNGVLNAGGNEILGNYTLGLTGPGLFAEIEDFALDIVNENTDALTQIAFDAFVGIIPTLGICPTSGFFVGICNGIVNGLVNNLDPNTLNLGITVDSFALSADYTYMSSITPVPLPAALPLMAGGIALIGLMGMRRRRAVAA